MDRTQGRVSPVLVVDHDQDSLSEVGTLLRRAGYETWEVASGAEALEAVRERRPRLVVLELWLPDLSGYEVCRELKEACGDELPIIFLSAHRTEAYDRVAGLLVGADHYIVKPFAADELLASARALLRRFGRPGPPPKPRHPALTQREFEILNLLSSGLGQGEIATRLVITEKTVGTHIERILPKLGVHSRAQAVALAYREGLVEAPAERPA